MVCAPHGTRDRCVHCHVGRPRAARRALAQDERRTEWLESNRDSRGRGPGGRTGSPDDERLSHRHGRSSRDPGVRRRPALAHRARELDGRHLPAPHRQPRDRGAHPAGSRIVDRPQARRQLPAEPAGEPFRQGIHQPARHRRRCGEQARHLPAARPDHFVAHPRHRRRPGQLERHVRSDAVSRRHGRQARRTALRRGAHPARRDRRPGGRERRRHRRQPLADPHAAQGFGLPRRARRDQPVLATDAAMNDQSQLHAVAHPAGGRGTALPLPGGHSYAGEMAANLSAAERFEESFNLRDMMRIFLKRKWTILIIFAVFALFSVVRTYLAPPVYRASTTIQIEKFQPRVLDYKEVTPLEVSVDNSDFYQTNYELLKSRTLAERTVEDIGLRKASSAAAAAQDSPKTIPGTDPHSAGSILDDLFQRMVKGPVPVAIDPATRDDNSLVMAFQSSITVEPVRRSRLVRLHFDSTDPFFAAKAVNTLAQSFININLERRFEASSYAKTFLEEKLQQTKAKLEDSERELVGFSRDLEIFNLDEKQQSISSQNLHEFNAAVSKAEQERIRAEAVSKQALGNPDALASVQEHRNLLGLKDRKAKLETEYQENLKVYKPAFPKMQQLQGQIAEVDKQLREEYQDVRKTALSTYRTARTQETMLNERLGGAKRQLLDLQGRSIRYGILKREVDTNRTLYDGLLQRLKEIGVAGGVGLNNISVGDKAPVPPYPFKPP